MYSTIKSKKCQSFIIVLVITFLIVNIDVGAFNAERRLIQTPDKKSEIVSPLWDNVNTSTLSLDFSDDKINIYVRLLGIVGTKYKNGTVTIYKHIGGEYVRVKSWTGISSANKKFVFSNSELDATSGVKYKLSIKITAYTSSNSEVVKANKVSTCP